MDQKRWADAVSATIRAERAVAQLSQQELAKRAGIPRPTYLRYESGERSPSVVQIAQIAEALGMPLSAFAKRIEERSHGDGSAVTGHL